MDLELIEPPKPSIVKIRLIMWEDELSQEPSDDVEIQSSAGLSADGLILSDSLLSPATQEGERCVVVDSHETQASALGADENPLGNAGAKKRRPGRKRFKVRSMYGRFPWTACVNDLEAQATGFAELTKKDRHRAFHRIGHVLESLQTEGKVSTLNPAKLSEPDVAAFLDWCARSLDASTARKYLRHLNEVCAFAGNGVIGAMKAKRVARFPKPAKKPIYAHAEATIKALLAACEGLANEWWAWSAKAVIALGAYSGLRSGEIRYAKLADLDTVRWQIRVSHPKGLNRWATGEEVSPIMPQAEPILRDYLAVRDAFLRTLEMNPLEVEPLFPFWNQCSTKNPIVGYWKDARWNDLQQAVERASGIRFRWKDLRPTYGQAAKDRGVPIEKISKALRHTSTATTEAWYVRIRSEAAFGDLRRAFSESVSEP